MWFAYLQLALLYDTPAEDRCASVYEQILRFSPITR